MWRRGLRMAISCSGWAGRPARAPPRCDTATCECATFFLLICCAVLLAISHQPAMTQYALKYKLLNDIQVRGLLTAGGKSFTHTVVALERYVVALQSLLVQAGPEVRLCLQPAQELLSDCLHSLLTICSLHIICMQCTWLSASCTTSC